MADGTTGGPYHHYCKGISDEMIQCLLFESTDANAPLVAVEYFVGKDLARKDCRYYHGIGISMIISRKSHLVACKFSTLHDEKRSKKSPRPHEKPMGYFSSLARGKESSRWDGQLPKSHRPY